MVDAATPGMPEGWWLATTTPVFSEDGRRLLLNTQPKPEDAGKSKKQLEEEKKEREAEGPRAELDLWHWKDPLLQPQQLLLAGRERNRGYRAVLNLRNNKFVQLANEQLKTVMVDPRSTGDLAIGLDQEKYRMLSSWDSPGYTDVYLIDLNTGASRLVQERIRGSAQMSPAGKYITWWDPDGRKQMLLALSREPLAQQKMEAIAIEGIPVSLANELHDTPAPPRSYGQAGWLDEDQALLLYDRYDIWRIDPALQDAPVCLTGGKGREQNVVYRRVRLDRDARSINPHQAQFLSAFNERSKASGYARLDLSGEGNLPQHEMVLDERVGGLVKAEEADTVIFTRESFRRSPDLWASTLEFANVSRLSMINPQQREYSWGTAELIEYTSADGTPLQGILYKPDSLDDTKKIPLMVYFYERNSDNLHAYHVPAAGRSIINFSFYVSRGYAVFIPDIPYRTGYPGQSAYDAVIPGIERVLEMGFVDKQRVGVQGHSWGGYQIAYLVTQTNVFACAEAGAPVSNMTSAYGGIRWGSGMSRMFQYERTQSRIGQPLWEARDLYLENSPLFHVQNIQTPLLILHNDQDGAVPWYQGIELFVAMRRLGKPCWMLNYNGEPHWVMKDENRIDFAKRMQQFFDHYLMDAPAPRWLVDGIPAVDKGEEFGFEPATEEVEEQANESEPSSGSGTVAPAKKN